MSRIFTLALVPLLSGIVWATAPYSVRRVSLQSSTVQEDLPSPLPVAPFVANLTQKVSRPSDKASALRHIAKKGRGSTLPDTATVFGTGQDEEYAVNITIGGQDFAVIIGTSHKRASTLTVNN